MEKPSRQAFWASAQASQLFQQEDALMLADPIAGGERAH